MKRKGLLLALLSISAFCVNAHADDVFKDVTNTYLTNADFEGEYSVYSNPKSDRAIYQPTGWTVTYTSGDTNDMTALNSSCLQWSNFSSKAQLTNGGENTYWIRLRWGTGATLKLSQGVTLPTGKYTISADYYKSGTGGDGYIFVGETEKNTNVNENVWKNLSIDYESDGMTATTIGCYAKHTAEYEKFLAFDNFVIKWNLTQSLSSLISKAQTFLSEDPSNTNLENAITEANSKVNSTDAEELESAYNSLASVISLLDSHKKWIEAKEAAQQAIADASYNGVTGNERTALSEEIAKDEPTTADDYRVAIEALNNATAAFTAAKTGYDALVTAKADAAAYTAEAWPYASDDKKTALDNAVGAADPTTAADAETKANAIVTAYRQFVESNGQAEGVEGAVDLTSSLTYSDAAVKVGWSGINTNSGEGYTDGDGQVSAKYFDGGWSSNASANIAVTQEVTLPAGKYLLQITARGATALNTYTMSVGETSVDLPQVGSTGGTFGRGWSDKYIVFETDGTTPSTITITANSTEFQQWVSFNRLRLIRLELYADMATAEDYAALAGAIETAEAKALGFDAGEYAPYKNLEALQTLAAAKAIDSQVENEKAGVVNATEALNNATWTENTEEVNAIFDGGFETDYSSQSGNVQPIGWYRVKGTTGDGYNVRYMGGTNAGLAATSTGKALFTKFAAFYGWEDGYTMPLNADTYYEVTFVYGGWGDCKKDGFVTITDPQGNNIELSIDRLPLDAVDGDSNPDSWKQYRGVFKTGDAGNYVLGLRKDNESVQSQYVYGDFNLVKATPITIDKDVELVAGKYATRIYPFAPAAIEGITFYSCAAVEGTTLSLKEETELAANTPYILGNDATEAISITQTGVDIHGNDTYTEGRLTGIFAPITLNVNDAETYYVLQTLNGKQAFYVVDGEFAINTLYRAYLSVPKNEATGVKAFNLGVDDATAINTLDVLTSGAYEGIYTVDGIKLNRIEKGVNILKMADGTTRKVIVK